MNLFTEIENKKNERLAVSVLRYLITKNSLLRSSFLDQISKKCKRGIIECQSNFSVEEEVFTETNNEDVKNNGRIDLLIETDSHLIGIEAKLGAAISEDQPAKYIETLSKRFNHSKDFREKLSQTVIILLVPEWQSGEAHEVLNKVNESEVELVLLTWKDIFEGFKDVLENDKLNEISLYEKSLYYQFKEYVGDSNLIFPKIGEDKFKILWAQMLRTPPNKSSEFQKNFLGQGLWRLLECGGSRLGGSLEHLGYYFYPRENAIKDKEYGWYGFVKRTQIENEEMIGKENLNEFYHDDENIFMFVTYYETPDELPEKLRENVCRVNDIHKLVKNWGTPGTGWLPLINEQNSKEWAEQTKWRELISFLEQNSKKP